MVLKNCSDKGSEDRADYQKAVAATKFGLYNVMLMLISLPASWSNQSESTLTSYIVPAAACDLNLSPTQKGLLNSMPFFGMVSTGFLWGFLLDTLGRRKVLLLGFSVKFLMTIGKALSHNVTLLSIFTFLAGSIFSFNNGLFIILGMVSTGFLWGFLLDTLGRRKVLLLGFSVKFLMTIGKALSHNVTLLSIFTFLAGSITGGMYVALTTYVMEFNSTEYRNKIQMSIGLIYALGNILIPIVASGVLPLDIKMNLGIIEFHTWNLLLFVMGINEIISIIAFYFLPETPKFLMSVGKNNQALKIFRKMYNINTKDFEKNYPIKILIEEIESTKEPASEKKSWIEYMKVGWEQVRPLFGKKFGMKLLLVCTVQSTISMGVNSLRIYMPQIFQATHDYQVMNNETSSRLCDVLDVLRSSPEIEENIPCVVDTDVEVYMNSMVIAVVVMVAYIIAGTLINFFGRKPLLITLGLCASVASNCLYFSTHTAVTLALSSIYLMATNIAFDICMTIIIVIFPTTLRGMAVSICLTTGRSLTVVGNMLLPIFVEMGCAPPFMCLGSVILLAVLLTLLLPNTDKDDMK